MEEKRSRSCFVVSFVLSCFLVFCFVAVILVRWCSLIRTLDL